MEDYIAFLIGAGVALLILLVFRKQIMQARRTLITLMKDTFRKSDK
jgi:hypothetical protein